MKLILLLCLFFSPLVFSKTYTVKMLNSSDGKTMVFEPSYLQVKKGDIVEFIPTDNGHNTKSVFTPKGQKEWQSENNKNHKVVFTHEGINIFECTNHAIMAMVGIIVVDSAANKEEATKFSEKYQKKFVLNKKRLSNYLSLID